MPGIARENSLWKNLWKLCITFGDIIRLSTIYGQPNAKKYAEKAAKNLLLFVGLTTGFFGFSCEIFCGVYRLPAISKQYAGSSIHRKIGAASERETVTVEKTQIRRSS